MLQNSKPQTSGQLKKYQYKSFLDTYNLSVENIPFYYGDSTSDIGFLQFLHESTLNLSHESPQLVHNLVHNENLDGDSYLKDRAVEYIFNFAKENNIDIKKLLRVKLNLLLKNKVDKKFFHNPHIDRAGEQHKVLIFYQNDSDGDTIVFNEKFSEKRDTILSINKRVRPEKGKVIDFDGDIWHTSSSPCNINYRLVMNVNYVI